MFQESRSIEEFNGFSKIDVHFLNERSFFTFFVPLTCQDHIPFELLLFGPTRYKISEKIRALACPLFEISTVKVYVQNVKNERSFKKMNIDFAKTIEFLD